MFKSLALLFVAVAAVQAHVRMMSPPSRSSVWRLPEYSDKNLTPNYNDDAVWCTPTQQEAELETCGVCGHGVNDPKPTPNMNGGQYGTGLITGNYKAGSTIDVEIEWTTSHLGTVEINLCPSLPETEACFRANPLKIEGEGDDNIWYLPENNVPVWHTLKATLPSGVTCSHCTLRLSYRDGNNWGTCKNGTQGMGCGLQETFRNCADISLY